MDPGDDLLVRGDEPVANEGLSCGRSGRCTDIVNTFEKHGVGNARVGEDVAIDATECIGPETVVQDAVSARGLVEDGDVGCGVLFLHVG